MCLWLQVSTTMERKDRQVSDLEEHTMQLQKKLEQTHSDLSSRIYAAQEEAEKVGAIFSVFPAHVGVSCVTHRLSVRMDPMHVPKRATSSSKIRKSEGELSCRIFHV